MAHKFVGLSEDHKKIYLYELNVKTGNLKKERQVLWGGDWLSIKDNYDFSDIGPGC